LATPLLWPRRKAELPASSTNTVAHRWVIQRVQNQAGVVAARSSGLNGVGPKKSRVWSSAIRAMTKPRSMSIAGSLAGLIMSRPLELTPARRREDDGFLASTSACIA
jgi:hypothetical protein